MRVIIVWFVDGASRAKRVKEDILAIMPYWCKDCVGAARRMSYRRLSRILDMMKTQIISLRRPVRSQNPGW